MTEQHCSAGVHVHNLNLSLYSRSELCFYWNRIKPLTGRGDSGGNPDEYVQLVKKTREKTVGSDSSYLSVTQP